MRITVTVQDDKVQRLLTDLKGKSKRIIADAVNKTIENTKTQAIRKVADESRAQQKYVRKATKVKKASYSKPVAILSMSSRRLPVTAFKARQTKKGITFVGRNGRRELVPRAFIQRAASKRNWRGAWMRKFSRTGSATGLDYAGRGRRGRLPLRKLKAVSVGHVMFAPSILNHLHNTISTRWQINIHQAIDRVL